MKGVLMSPYVALQEVIIAWLFHLQQHDQKRLQDIIELCRSLTSTTPSDWAHLLRSHRLGINAYESWYKDIDFPRLILEQIDDSGDEVVIKNVLGSPLHHRSTVYGLRGWLEHRGSGHNLLRARTYAQPSALRDGDILITGERVIGLPREGGNGSVLVHLSGGGKHGVWLSFPSRTALALFPSGKKPPVGLLEV